MEVHYVLDVGLWLGSCSAFPDSNNSHIPVFLLFSASLLYVSCLDCIFYALISICLKLHHSSLLNHFSSFSVVEVEALLRVPSSNLW